MTGSMAGTKCSSVTPVMGSDSTVVCVAWEEKTSPSVWDDRGWFGLVSGNDFVYDIVPTMLAQ